MFSYKTERSAFAIKLHKANTPFRKNMDGEIWLAISHIVSMEPYLSENGGTYTLIVADNNNNVYYVEETPKDILEAIKGGVEDGYSD